MPKPVKKTQPKVPSPQQQDLPKQKQEPTPRKEDRPEKKSPTATSPTSKPRQHYHHKKEESYLMFCLKGPLVIGFIAIVTLLLVENGRVFLNVGPAESLFPTFVEPSGPPDSVAPAAISPSENTVPQKEEVPQAKEQLKPTESKSKNTDQEVKATPQQATKKEDPKKAVEETSKSSKTSQSGQDSLSQLQSVDEGSIFVPAFFNETDFLMESVGLGTTLRCNPHIKTKLKLLPLEEKLNNGGAGGGGNAFVGKKRRIVLFKMLRTVDLQVHNVAQLTVRQDANTLFTIGDSTSIEDGGTCITSEANLTSMLCEMRPWLLAGSNCGETVGEEEEEIEASVFHVLHEDPHDRSRYASPRNAAIFHDFHLMLQLILFRRTCFNSSVAMQKVNDYHNNEACPHTLAKEFSKLLLTPVAESEANFLSMSNLKQNEAWPLFVIDISEEFQMRVQQAVKALKELEALVPWLKQALVETDIAVLTRTGKPMQDGVRTSEVAAALFLVMQFSGTGSSSHFKSLCLPRVFVKETNGIPRFTALEGVSEPGQLTVKVNPEEFRPKLYKGVLHVPLEATMHPMLGVQELLLRYSASPFSASGSGPFSSVTQRLIEAFTAPSAKTFAAIVKNVAQNWQSIESIEKTMETMTLKQKNDILFDTSIMQVTAPEERKGVFSSTEDNFKCRDAPFAIRLDGRPTRRTVECFMFASRAHSRPKIFSQLDVPQRMQLLGQMRDAFARLLNQFVFRPVKSMSPAEQISRFVLGLGPNAPTSSTPQRSYHFVSRRAEIVVMLAAAEVAFNRAQAFIVTEHQHLQASLAEINALKAKKQLIGIFPFHSEYFQDLQLGEGFGCGLLECETNPKEDPNEFDPTLQS